MKLKFLLVLLLIVVGIWMGINFAKNKPLFSNPFAEKELRDRVSDTATKAVEESREAIKRTFEGQ